jgi:hypothetical protein
MSAVLGSHAASNDFGARLAFQKQLQVVTNKIHATSNIDEIMLEMSAEVCALFHADRLTIYSMAEDKQSIVSKVKTGLNSFKDLKLPIAEHSIAGYAAFAKKTLNIKDVYDDAELRSLNPNLRFLQEVDKRTGYRTKQMLVSPIIEAGGHRAHRRDPGDQPQDRHAVRRDGRGRHRRARADPRDRLQAAPEARRRQDQVRLPGLRRRAVGG